MPDCISGEDENFFVNGDSGLLILFSLGPLEADFVWWKLIMGAYDTTIGTLLVGIFFNTFLYGLVTYQFAVYHQIKFNDGPVIRYTVLFLFVLDTFHSTSVIYMAWYYTVTNYDRPAVLTAGLWPYTFTPIGTALAALATQMYLGFRILRLTGSKLLYGIVIFLAIPSFALSVICSVEAWIIKVLRELPRITPLVIAWLTTQVAVDMFITATLVIVFSRSRTGFRNTDTILNRLIRCAIQTGLFSGIFSLGDLITFILFPDTNLYGMFAIPIGRIYTNTLLDTLLARELLQAEMDGTNNMSEMVDTVYLGPISTAESMTTRSVVPNIGQGI